MALTEEERARVTHYLGYSALENNSPLVRALAALDAFPGATVIIRETLDELRVVDAEIRGLAKIALAVKDGAVELRAAYSLQVLRAMGRQAVGRVASTLSVPVKRDVFSDGAPGTVDSGDPSGPSGADYAIAALGSNGCH